MAGQRDFSGDLPIFRPRVGGRGGQIRGSAVPRFRNTLIGALERAGKLHGRTAPATRKLRNQFTARDVPVPGKSARRCLIKARYVRVSGQQGVRAARTHLSYIERDGVEPDGSKGRLFGAVEDVQLDKFLDPHPKEPHQFRFIVSPEDAGELDLRTFTRDLMAQAQADLGRDLRWAAVCHHDTDNPHVHIVVRGVDRDGKALTIDPRYLSHGLRHRAQEIATRDLGPRFEWDMQRQIAKEVMQERCTSLDKRIEPLVDEVGAVDIGALHRAAPAEKAYLVGRLAFLETLHLASRTSPSSWRLEPGWQESLAGLGQRDDIIKRMHRAMKEPPGHCRIFDGDTPGSCEGIVRKKGLHNEQGEELYAVVETARGEALYVRLGPDHAGSVQEGDLVRVESRVERWLKETDRVIAAVAAKDRGIYDPERHRAELEAHPIAIAGQPVPASEVVAVNLRRLERLARYRLVAPLPEGRWRVPDDLVQQLSERERSQPRSRVEIDRCPMRIEDQVSHPGPTWLDRCNKEGLSPRGFGAELSTAFHRRDAFVRTQGLNPGDPELVRKLGALQRQRGADLDRGLSPGMDPGMDL